MALHKTLKNNPSANSHSGTMVGDKGTLPLLWF